MDLRSAFRNRRWWRWALFLLAAPVVLLLCLYASVRLGMFGGLPTRAELAAIRNEEATLVLSREGAIIGKIFDRDRTNVRYEDLPQHLVDALIATEDRRFFEHEGVDLWSYVRVLVKGAASGGNSGGGSTISQQVVKNLYGRKYGSGVGLLIDKMREVIIAQRLESVYTKQEVILLYLNTVPFGENAYGVEAAAQRSFGRHARTLRIEEAAVLIGLLKANTAYNPRLHPEASRRRRDEVLSLMGEQGALPPSTMDSLRALPLVLDHRGATAYDAYGYFVDEVKQQAKGILAGYNARTGSDLDLQKDGLRIETTIDTTLQRMAADAVRAHLRGMQKVLNRQLQQRRERRVWEKEQQRTGGLAWKRNERRVRRMFEWSGAWADSISYRDSLWHYARMLHGAVLMMEPAGGRVLAWVGGNDHRFLPFDLITAPHPMGSTIKPFLYAAAIDQGMDPCTKLDNERRMYADYDDWSPENYDRSSGGRTTMWYALSRSLNLPTVDLYFRTGTAAIERTFGHLRLPVEGLDHPASALGALDMTLLNAVQGYCAFANEGRLPSSTVLIERIVDGEGRTIHRAPKQGPRAALAAGTAAAITAMLQRAVNEGTGSSLRTRVSADIAAKTGTAQDDANAWFIAYTPALVCGAWVGCRHPRIHLVGPEGSGARLALPIVSGVFDGVERKGDLRKRYLKPFTWVDEEEIEMSCDPLHDPGGLERTIDELFGPEHRRGDRARRDSSGTKKRNIRQKGSLFDRIFKKK